MPLTGTALENASRGTKRAHTEDVAEEGEDGATTSAGQAGAAAGRSTASGYTCPRSKISDEWHIITFKKSHKLLSYGLAPTVYTKKITQTTPFQSISMSWGI
jgi:hypothetical protein